MKTFKSFREQTELQEAKKCSECGCDPKNPKEECDCEHENMSEASMDGVAAGSLEGDKHMCATKIFKEGFGEGVPIKGEHAEPDEFGNISWYTTMFDHGIETVEVQEEGVKILAQEAHMNHKKKMKEEVEEIEEISKKTLGSYIKKATGVVHGAGRASKDFERDAKAARSPAKKASNQRIAMDFSKKAIKRTDGIAKAADKLVNK